MNKAIRFFLLIGLVSLSLASCKSKQIVTEIQSAYEPATIAEAVVEPEYEPEQQFITPIDGAFSNPVPPVTPEPPAEPEVTRAESFKMAEGETNTTAFNKKYHVQVGAFKNHANARNLRTKLVSQGNNSFVVENDTGFLRVIIESFDGYREAREKINQIKGTYPDAWILVQK